MFKFKNITIASIALAGAFAASSASANGSYGHSYYSGTTTYGTTYSAPTINLGPIELVQPNSTTQYVQPTTTWVQPATTSTYTYPSSSYTTQTYTAPSYTTPSYAAQTTYVQPNYGQPVYTSPAILPHYYDGTERVRSRMDRLRARIQHASDRGDLRNGERRKLRRKMRNIREHIRAYRANDGIIDRAEHAELNEKMSRQARRIRRLGNNHRVQGPLVSPYGHGHYTRY